MRCFYAYTQCINGQAIPGYINLGAREDGVLVTVRTPGTNNTAGFNVPVAEARAMAIALLKFCEGEQE